MVCELRPSKADNNNNNNKIVLQPALVRSVHHWPLPLSSPGDSEEAKHNSPGLPTPSEFPTASGPAWEPGTSCVLSGAETCP